MKVDLSSALKTLQDSVEGYTAVNVELSQHKSSEPVLKWKLYGARVGKTAWSLEKDSFEEALKSLKEELPIGSFLEP